MTQQAHGAHPVVPTVADPSAAWLAVDCDVCGAEMGQPCRRLSCGDDACTSSICALVAKLKAAGEMYCGGGSRERAEHGIMKGSA